ncbi:ECF RNA polymerase sigma factor SigK [Nocardia sp. 348MFTsu5.1]|uniref:ECF RNA polymerase sigma factor SigK n=1 Tax=Nocardia sp. 348MFTsu5.1 TaxID=1172185 RepID=UPI0012DE9989|nr:ECF RNA polymerase sigma factor SigK [Nocardia sp. 348MFTsu5.1]
MTIARVMDVTDRIPEARVDLADLLIRTADRDRAAFADLYDATSARVFGLICRVLRDRGYAEETLQEVYLQVWQKAEGFDPAAGSALSWMMTIAHRRAVDRVRSEEAASRRSTDYSVSNLELPSDVVADSVVSREERAGVVFCLDSLTSTQRQSIELSYYGGLTYRQVAERLDAALPTVKSRIRDGLRRLKQCLEANPRG